MATATMELIVLGSGSRGNCSVIRVRDHVGERLVLVDLGFSPRRTAALLEQAGLATERVVGAVLTHLDRDHCHAGWCRAGALARPPMVHWAHARRAECEGLNAGKVQTFVRDEEVAPGIVVSACLSAHDHLGVAVLRFTCAGRSVGYATDLGCVTEDIVDHLHRVSVLAIESNYCPQLQAESDRPDFLKRRITGGMGHLSNEESARAASLIKPGGGGGDVVLLHLSSECNRPDRAIAAHAPHALRVTVSSQDAVTPPITAGLEVITRPPAQMSLFG